LATADGAETGCTIVEEGWVLEDPKEFGRELADYAYSRIREEELTGAESSTLFGIKVAQRAREMEARGWSGRVIADEVELVAGCNPSQRAEGLKRPGTSVRRYPPGRTALRVPKNHAGSADDPSTAVASETQEPRQ
jgi:hypothetical protein